MDELEYKTVSVLHSLEKNMAKINYERNNITNCLLNVVNLYASLSFIVMIELH